LHRHTFQMNIFLPSYSLLLPFCKCLFFKMRQEWNISSKKTYNFIMKLKFINNKPLIIILLCTCKSLYTEWSNKLTIIIGQFSNTPGQGRPRWRWNSAVLYQWYLENNCSKKCQCYLFGKKMLEKMSMLLIWNRCSMLRNSHKLSMQKSR